MNKLLLGLMIGSIALPAAAQSVREGIEAWQKGDTAGAVAIWRPLAEQGDADAAFNLGQAYRLGKGVPIDLAKAQDWLDRAARQGHVDAQATLGLLLFQNGNRVSAMRWLNAAAEAGEARALLMVGTALYNGDGVAEDHVKAYAYISRAAAQGLAPAKATLADLDSIMPLEQRKKGVALAQQLAGAGKQAAAAAKPPKAASARPAQPKLAATKPAAGAKAPAAANGNWRIQLGAFGQRKSAEALFAKMSAKLAGRQAYYVPAGSVVRLQAGPFASRAEASATCSRLAPQPCFAVAAK